MRGTSDPPQTERRAATPQSLRGENGFRFSLKLKPHYIFTMNINVSEGSVCKTLYTSLTCTVHRRLGWLAYRGSLEWLSQTAVSVPFQPPQHSPGEARPEAIPTTNLLKKVIHTQHKITCFNERSEERKKQARSNKQGKATLTSD